MKTVIQSEEHVGSEGWEASVSAWIDGEESIRAEELNTPYGRRVWDTYHLIGDVLRNDGLAIVPSERFYARLSQAIDQEPTVLAPRRHWRHPVRLGVSGIVVAAAVASVIWVAVPYLGGAGGASELTPVVASASEAPGLTDYLDAHSQLIGEGPVRQVSFDPEMAR